MNAIFLGGSRRISKLHSSVRAKLDAAMASGRWIFVGDANGADKAFQMYLAEREYRRVLVYSAAGLLRNNIGNWEVRQVDVPRGSRGFDFYAVKDVAMAKDASAGLMLWDGKSRGTRQNLSNLLSGGKPVDVYLSSRRRVFSLTRPEQIDTFVSEPETILPNQQTLELGVSSVGKGIVRDKKARGRIARGL